MSKRLLLVPICLLLALGGCSDDQPDQAGKYSLTDPIAEVPAEEASAAQAAVDAARAAVADAVGDLDGVSDGEKAFRQDLAVLCRNPHRLAGYEDGSLAAADYVENRLKAMGIQLVQRQGFPVVQPVTTEAKLTVDGQDYPLYLVRPNNIQASVTPAGGTTAKTVYVGKGATPDYGAMDPRGKIVVMDFDCEKNWLNAFAFGAQAVLFVGPEDPKIPASVPYQHVNVPANLPRFYIPHDLATKLKLIGPDAVSREITLKAAVEWRELHGCNVVAVLRGAKPLYGDKKLPQAIVLAAPLDTYGQVPELCPGARLAGNVAALLQIAETLQAERPNRDVILAFFDAQGLNHLGARAFYGALYRNTTSGVQMSLPKYMESLVAERDYYRAVQGIVLQPSMFRPDPDKVSRAQWPDLAARADSGDQEAAAQLLERFELVEDTMDTAFRVSGVVRIQQRLLASDVLAKLRLLRLEERKFRHEIRQLEDAIATAETQGDTQAVEELQAGLAKCQAQIDALAPEIAELDLNDQIWNTVERVLHEKLDVFGDPQEVRQALGELYKDELDADVRTAKVERTPQFVRDLVAATERACATRIAELDLSLAEAAQSIRLMNTIGPSYPERNAEGEILLDGDEAQMTGTDIVLHIGVNLGDTLDAWTFIHGEDSNPAHADPLGNYNAILKTVQTVSEQADYPNFDARAVGRTLDNRQFGARLYADSTAIARIYALFNLSVMTVMDPLARQGQPADRLDALDIPTMYAQVAQVGPFLSNLIGQDGLNLSPKDRPAAKFVERSWTRGTVSGGRIMQIGAGSAMADLPVPGAIVSINPKPYASPWQAADVETCPPGMVYPILLRAKTDGSFEHGPFSTKWHPSSLVVAATFDQDLRVGPDAPARERTRGVIRATTSQKTLLASLGGYNHAVETFQCQPITFVGYGFDRSSIATQAMRALSTSEFRKDSYMLAELGNLLSLYAPADAAGVKLFNANGLVVLNNLPTKQDYLGRGLALTSSYLHPETASLTASGLLNLNDYRLEVLRVNRITQDSLTEINGVARDQYDDALTAGPAGGWDTFVGSLASAAGRSRRAYLPLVSIMNDLVTAVVLLLLMAIPFAYALERLIIGTPHIYRQICWFAGFFLLTFGLLFLVNPAFQIAATPTIIFLAFTIILLSSLVIFILVRKLQAEIKKMQGLATTVHSMDVSRLSTMVAAVNMGISTMRRRWLRTLLTATTVILLTFTILTFASFGSSWDVQETYVGPASGPGRMITRHQLWSPMSMGLLDTLRGTLKDNATVVGRYWLSPTTTEAANAVSAGRDLDFLLATEDAKKLSLVSAGIGLDPIDVERQPALAELLDGDASLLKTDGVFVTPTVAGKLGLTADDVGKTTILLYGRELTFAGFLSERMASHLMLDGSKMLPVNYAASAGAEELKQMGQSQSDTLTEQPDTENAQFVEYNVDSVVILPPDIARQLGGDIRMITTYPNDPAETDQLARLAAQIGEVPTYYARQGGVYRAIFKSLQQASGWRDLLIPVILGGLIVFATMLGSVSDREREIYTFSSLGLAPVHVAGLFFAEAAIYAIVGGMGGYLLGQVVARLMAWLGSMGLISVPSMNYSSTNAIVTILIVMSTVVISTIWPAMKASRSANPGIQRSWRIPKPDGDQYDLKFPFTVSAYDITGVVSFLKEHFDNNTDSSSGLFANMENHIFRQETNDMLGFTARVALVPFDLGVTQRYALLSQPSEIEGIDEVRILIRRLSGTNGDWRRANRVFVNDLRKQLLIWRSLPPDVMDKYRQQTLDAWEHLPRETYDAKTMGEATNE